MTSVTNPTEVTDTGYSDPLSDGQPYLSYVVPLLNEAPSLNALYARICTATEALGHRFEIIFVDDGSRDDSFELIRQLHQSDPRVRALRFGRNRGKSDALQAGCNAVRGELVITMDADLQDDPDEVARLIAALNEGGYDLVSGWKVNRQDPVEKRLFSKLFNRVTGYFSGVDLHDFNCGFKVYRREVTDSLRVYGEMHRFLPVLAHWNGFKVGELGVKHHPRRFGASHFGASRILKGLFDFTTVMFLMKFEKRPLHLFGFIGLMCLLAGGGISAWFVVEWLLGADMYLRPVMVGGWVLIVMGIQFVSMGLLGEMLARHHHKMADMPIRERLG